MLERVLFAGSGGQGVLSIGRLLAYCALPHVEHLTFFPSYGAEVRGGTANCQVVLSDREIPSPVVDRFDSMLLLNQQSVDRFGSLAAENGLIVLNRSLCPEPLEGAVQVEASDLARDLGDVRAANLIMLGAYLARKPHVPTAEIETAVRQRFESKGRELVDLNIRALRRGLDSVSATD